MKSGNAAPTKPANAARTKPRSDLIVAGLAVALVAAAAVGAVVFQRLGHPVHAGAAPLFAHWLPHAGPGTLPALAVAALVVRYGPALALRLRWRALLAAAYVTALAWTLSLALVDGWQRGLAGRLTTGPEYLTEVPGVTSIPAMLRGFTGRILDHQPDSWTTHVAGHPPGALLIFTALDRLGLSGGAWAGLLCVAAGALTAVAVPVTVRLLVSDRAARAAAPFVALFPGAIWIGVSADGLFAGVTATGVACLALGLVRRSGPAAFAGGLLLGLGAYLSYGLVLMSAIAAAVLLAARHRAPNGRHRAWWAVAGAAVPVAAFTVAGFDWLTGYHLLIQRYYQGIAAHRPYAYWVWADLAAVTIAAGPVAAVIVRRAVAARRGPWLLPLAAVAAILAADLSGYSKAEVERIWLPFAVWLMAGAGLLPNPARRRWLIAQAALALAINHLFLTAW
ncbi:hypothetical protein ACFQS1_03035 [Paractinoplanes rhizophilus]|uniref:Integral membrane protein n=1 Tax=Paractinoplanes rhizophilus TaxID=1416877 RepID=A0ABW2HN56_9ACTN